MGFNSGFKGLKLKCICIAVFITNTGTVGPSCYTVNTRINTTHYCVVKNYLFLHLNLEIAVPIYGRRAVTWLLP